MSPLPEIKKKKKPSSTPQSTLKTASLLPHDLLLTILARVPRLYYPILSLVSKSFRSLVASPELYNVRSLLGQTESCLYVCLRLGSSFSWFTLSREPDQTKRMNSSGYVLAKVPIPSWYGSPYIDFSGLVAVGSDIYNVGAWRGTYLSPTSRVLILDCRSHEWREGPSLPMELELLSASVLDKKIYVAGCYRDKDSWKNSFEVAFNSKEGRWDMVDEPSMVTGGICVSSSFCEIDNVLYILSLDRILRWYDSEKRRWRDLKGLVGLPSLSSCFSGRLADYGGKMAVLCAREMSLSKMTTISCVVIALERRKSCEIWGKVEWFDNVLSVPGACKLVKVLAPTL
ncbi:F-box/kelch-repeat protein At3g08810 isoform X2 [Capsella rubella]|uniref:F-box/kelch-repeat protein At3g08810 isoform X2 n=1 Tax=Capsella rubella TaxID=81985 RepID=UPI000CD54C12|nr:F-box/kelch-repeat protein At3g08810 isoform X2 [Capsella rubella]